MTFRHYHWVVCLLAIIFSTLAFPFTADEIFERLKHSGEDFVNQGAICEQVAKLDMELEYPSPYYDIVTGVAYKDHQRIIGELDVVVFRRNDRSAVLVAEVKCWKNLGKALKKANDQKERFENVLHSQKPIHLYLVKDPQITYQVGQFTDPHETLAISQSGGDEVGFDMTLDFSLAELMGLRKRLMDCQNQGRCTKP